MTAGDGKTQWEKRSEVKKFIKLGQKMGLPIKDNGDFSFVGMCGVEHCNMYEEWGLQHPDTVGRSPGGYGLWQVTPMSRPVPRSTPIQVAAAVKSWVGWRRSKLD